MHFVQENLDTIPFKTLRRDEEKIGFQEQSDQMKKILQDDPALFLSKWGRYLPHSVLSQFQSIKDNYEVDFYLKSLLYEDEEEVSTRPAKSALRTLVQNRRYEYLKRHLKDSDYFSDESIQLRDPALYDQYIGQHISAQEKEEPFADDMTLVNRILSNIDRKFVDDHLHRQKIVDEEQMEEEEESESEDEILEKSTPTVITKKKTKDVNMTDSDLPKDDVLDSDEDNMEEIDENDTEEIMKFREEQRLELIRLLEEKFLAGKDDFDYDQVDYNEEYDDLEQLERDIQDRYFDED
ncbi:coiled-coil domain-containing protein-domain-containing protein [Mucor mucedo]|uniref:coiled-coil domain-containing protein-domain-containing protein n=1 Tax=Mucor mucedo TaxID=29922 RepID=UPI00221F346F|nr:coiled-coil domain-containing protein-domain-containing protein [Mucor mucedo]KAI7892215.1 coiled-coil domain-containing protein-domain-containing protein [Mucor mucedo]